MDHLKIGLVLVLSLSLFACGKSSDSAGKPPLRVVNRGEPNNLRYNWSVQEKTCDGEIVSNGVGSYFILSKDLIARVDTTTDTDTLNCKTVYAYLRNISSSDSTPNSYSESGVLRSGSAKKTCRVKQDGNVSSTPTTTTVAFPSEELTYQMKGADGILTLDIRGSAECNGLLSIKMKNQI